MISILLYLRLGHNLMQVAAVGCNASLDHWPVPGAIAAKPPADAGAGGFPSWVAKAGNFRGDAWTPRLGTVA